MLLNDRLVGSLGIVAPGDDSQIVKVAVQAARNGFGVVPYDFAEDKPACALGVRDAKKPHDCYHVLTEDTKVRAAFTRLTKDDKKVRLAIDLATSKLGITSDVSSWWQGPEISPALRMPDGTEYFVFDMTDASEVPDGVVTEGALLVPPSCVDGVPVVMVGQMNTPGEGMIDTAVWNDEITDLKDKVAKLEADNAAIKNALKVALSTLKEIKGKLDA